MGSSSSRPADASDELDVDVHRTKVARTTTTEWVDAPDTSPTEITSSSYKILVLGGAKVGKTALVRRWVQNSFDGDVYKPTSRVDIMSRIMAVGSGIVNLEVWDAPSHPEVRDHMLHLYFDGADAVVLVGDVMRPASFKDLGDPVMSSLREYCGLHYNEALPLIVMLANKRDMQEGPANAVMTEEICQITAETYGAERAFLTSAMTSDRVDDALDYVLQQLLVRPRRVWHPPDESYLQRAAERHAREVEAAALEKRMQDEADAEALRELEAAERAQRRALGLAVTDSEPSNSDAGSSGGAADGDADRRVTAVGGGGGLGADAAGDDEGGPRSQSRTGSLAGSASARGATQHRRGSNPFAIMASGAGAGAPRRRGSAGFLSSASAGPSNGIGSAFGPGLGPGSRPVSSGAGGASGGIVSAAGAGAGSGISAGVRRASLSDLRGSAGPGAALGGGVNSGGGGGGGVGSGDGTGGDDDGSPSGTVSGGDGADGGSGAGFRAQMGGRRGSLRRPRSGEYVPAGDSAGSSARGSQRRVIISDAVDEHSFPEPSEGEDEDAGPVPRQAPVSAAAAAVRRSDDDDHGDDGGRDNSGGDDEDDDEAPVSAAASAAAASASGGDRRTPTPPSTSPVRGSPVGGGADSPVVHSSRGRSPVAHSPVAGSPDSRVNSRANSRGGIHGGSCRGSSLLHNSSGAAAAVGADDGFDNDEEEKQEGSAGSDDDEDDGGMPVATVPKARESPRAEPRPSSPGQSAAAAPSAEGEGFDADEEEEEEEEDAAAAEQQVLYAPALLPSDPTPAATAAASTPAVGDDTGFDAED